MLINLTDGCLRGCLDLVCARRLEAFALEDLLRSAADCSILALEGCFVVDLIRFALDFCFRDLDCLNLLLGGLGLQLLF